MAALHYKKIDIVIFDMREGVDQPVQIFNRDGEHNRRTIFFRYDGSHYDVVCNLADGRGMFNVVPRYSGVVGGVVEAREPGSDLQDNVKKAYERQLEAEARAGTYTCMFAMRAAI